MGTRRRVRGLVATEDAGVFWVWWTAAALADGPAHGTLVAVGDGPVAIPPAADAEVTVPGGWVAVLDDCLQERAPSRWSVVNRVTGGETARSARRGVGALSELGPEVVVLGVGARELTDRSVKVQAFRADLQKLVKELRGTPSSPRVLLLGVVPSGGNHGEADGRRLAEWNAALSALAAEDDRVRFVDLLAAWPADATSAAALAAGPGGLTDQGHARVAAAVCDAVIGAASGDPK